MKSKGFTLIELLIAIAIIGILSALLMANFVGVRQKARDAQRKTNLRAIQSALDLYRADLGTYPTTSLYTCPSTGTKTQLGDDVNACNAIYMQVVPKDPLNTTTDYYYSSNGITYCLRACLENNNDGDKDTTTTNPSICSSLTQCAAGTVNYTVLNP